jgi:hypothetical protein
MIHTMPSRRLQHGDPVLEAQLIPFTNVLGTEPIVVAVVSVHHGVPKPVRFGLPGICLRLSASLFRSLLTPFNSQANRRHRLFHVFGFRGGTSFVLKGLSKLGAMRLKPEKQVWLIPGIRQIIT